MNGTICRIMNSNTKLLGDIEAGGKLTHEDMNAAQHAVVQLVYIIWLVYELI